MNKFGRERFRVRREVDLKPHKNVFASHTFLSTRLISVVLFAVLIINGSKMELLLMMENRAYQVTWTVRVYSWFANFLF